MAVDHFTQKTNVIARSSRWLQTVKRGSSGKIVLEGCGKGGTRSLRRVGSKEVSESTPPDGVESASL